MSHQSFRQRGVERSDVVAERDGAVLRRAREDELAAVDALTVTCYRPIQESCTSASAACVTRTWIRGSTTLTFRRAGPTRQSASTGPCPTSSTGRTLRR